MSEKKLVALCDDDPAYHEVVQCMLGQQFAVALCANEQQLLASIAARVPDVVLLDIRLRCERDGFDVLNTLQARWPRLPVIIHSGLRDQSSAVRAMRLGADDYVRKDCEPKELIAQIQQCIRHSRRGAGTAGCDLIGESAAIRDLRATIARFRDRPANVIVTGESGVGKEIVARMLRRGGEPFVAVDSATIQSATAESTLFGHARGAFTGADKTKVGLFEAANGGVIYFDELESMPLDVQAKLMRALQEKEITPLGSTVAKKIDFRVICATNRDLEVMTEAGTFREDLFHRLNVLSIDVPPLRDRLDDLPLLLDHFLAFFACPGQKIKVSEEVLKELSEYDWPGNVRELANTIERALAECDGDTILPRHLPPKLKARREQRIRQTAGSVAFVPAFATGSMVKRINAFERLILAHEYWETAGNISQMARQLVMSRSHLHKKLIQYEIHQLR